MKGLIAGAMKKAEPKKQAGETFEVANEEEQDAYERVVLAGIKAIYDDASGPQIMQALKSNPENPAETMAMITTALVQQIDEKMGGSVSGGILLNASTEILSELATAAEQAKLFQVDDSLLQRATQSTVAKLGEAYGAEPSDIEEIISGYGDDELGKMLEQQQKIAGMA
jgi:hypothetical protein